jgi:hypothetical protein
MFWGLTSVFWAKNAKKKCSGGNVVMAQGVTAGLSVLAGGQEICALISQGEWERLNLKGSSGWGEGDSSGSFPFGYAQGQDDGRNLHPRRRNGRGVVRIRLWLTQNDGFVNVKRRLLRIGRGVKLTEDFSVALLNDKP